MMTREKRGRSARRVGSIALAMALGLAIFASVAQAQKHNPIGVFGTAAQPEFPSAHQGEGAHGLAVDPATGDLLVVDQTEEAHYFEESGLFILLGNGVIRRFKPDGEPDPFSALGTNEIDPAETPEGEISFGTTSQVAVAPPGATGAGDIYVARREPPYAVDIFAPDGKYKGQLTEYKQGPNAEGAAAPLGRMCGGIAVDSEGAIYVGDEANGLVHKYVPAGDPPVNADSAANFSFAAGRGNGCALAAGAGPSAGSLFVAVPGHEVEKLGSETGELEYKFPVPGNNPTQISVNEASGRVFVGTGGEVFEYEASGEAASDIELVSRIKVKEAGSPITSGSGEVLGVAASPIAPPGERVYISAGAATRIGEWGAVQKNPPTLENQFVSTVGAHEATVNFTLGAEGAPTEYEVEYLDKGTYEAQGGFEGLATEHTAPVSIPPLNSTTPYTQALGGLAEDTTYYWRTLATNTCPPAEGDCDTTEGVKGEFTTTTEHPFSLLDGRVWELVSPRNGPAEFAVPGNLGGNAEFSVRPQQASPDGETITYTSFTSLGEPELNEPEGAALTSQYLSRRGPGGWTSQNLTPNFEEGYARDPLVGFSADLEHSAQIVFNPPCAGGAAPGFWNLCRFDPSGWAKTAVTTGEYEVGTENKKPSCLAFAGASASYDRIYFMARNAALLPGDPAPIGTGNGTNLYEWRADAPAGERLRLASVLPNGEAANKLAPSVSSLTSFGVSATVQPLDNCNMEKLNLRHAVSTDGARAFWTYDGGLATSLFARVPRESGPKTIQLDANQGGSGAGKGVYLDATPDGRYVFFTDQNKLTPSPAQANDLYRYDVAKGEAAEPQPLENLTAKTGEAANVQGLLGISEEGDVAYFVAKGVLTAAPNPSTGKSAVAGGSNLYAWVEGEGTRFIATLGSDGGDWSLEPNAQTARVSADGQRLVFLSSASLTGYDNTDASSGQADNEVFDYGLASETLRCVSCNPTGARPKGRSWVPGWSTPYQQPRYLLGDGRVFFESLDALDPTNDANGLRDVYEYEPVGVGSCAEAASTFSASAGGCIELLSSGQSEDKSYFLDASESGRDVFLSTRSRLVPQLDKDGTFDVYDARIGGSPPPGEAPPNCEGEACRGQGSAAPAPASAGTAAFQGAGNPKQPSQGRCPKGRHQVRRHGKARCVPRRHGKKHKRHHRKHKRANDDRRAVR